MKNNIFIPLALIMSGTIISVLTYHAPNKYGWFNQGMVVLSYSFSAFITLGGCLAIFFKLKDNRKPNYSEIQRKEYLNLENGTSKKYIFNVALKKTLRLFIPLLIILFVIYIIKEDTNINLIMILLSYFSLFIIHLFFLYKYLKYKSNEKKS